MQRNTTILTSLLAAVAAISGAIGCSSTSGPPSAGGMVSFKNDVMPIFHQSCTISSSCHGQMGNAGEANLYLGKNMNASQGGGDNDATSIMMTYAALVGVKSVEDPAMPLVTKGDPAKSYLIHKLNNTQGMFASDCTSAMKCPAPDCDMANPCGIQMPKTASALDSATIATVTNWVTQGALNN